MSDAPSATPPETQQERPVDDPDELGFHDRVRLVDLHHNMSDPLKEHEGDTGRIEDTDRGREGQKALVKFDSKVSSKIGERFVVFYKRLARIDDETCHEAADPDPEPTPKRDSEENNVSDDP